MDEEELEEVSEVVWARRAAARQRQIDIGKARPEYQWYEQTWPVPKRLESHPVTPDPLARISKRAFDRQLSTWRRHLHNFDEHVGLENVPGQLKQDAWPYDQTPLLHADGSITGQKAETDLSPGTESTRADSEVNSPPLLSGQSALQSSTAVTGTATGSRPRRRDIAPPEANHLLLADLLQPPVQRHTPMAAGSHAGAASGFHGGAGGPRMLSSPTAQVMMSMSAPSREQCPMPGSATMGAALIHPLMRPPLGWKWQGGAPVIAGRAQLEQAPNAAMPFQSPMLWASSVATHAAPTQAVAPAAATYAATIAGIALQGSGGATTVARAVMRGPAAPSNIAGRTVEETPQTLECPESGELSYAQTAPQESPTSAQDAGNPPGSTAAPTTPRKNRVSGGLSRQSSPRGLAYIETPSPQQAPSQGHVQAQAEVQTGPPTAQAVHVAQAGEAAHVAQVAQAAQAAQAAAQAQFGRPLATPAQRLPGAFYPVTPGGSGSQRGGQAQWPSSGSTPHVPFMVSPGVFSFCRPAPHIVTPVPPPLPFNSPHGTQGLTPGPKVPSGPCGSANCGAAPLDYTALCMAEWRRGGGT